MDFHKFGRKQKDPFASILYNGFGEDSPFADWHTSKDIWRKYTQVLSAVDDMGLDKKYALPAFLGVCRGTAYAWQLQGYIPDHAHYRVSLAHAALTELGAKYDLSSLDKTSLMNYALGMLLADVGSKAKGLSEKADN